MGCNPSKANTTTANYIMGCNPSKANTTTDNYFGEGLHHDGHHRSKTIRDVELARERAQYERRHQERAEDRRLERDAWVDMAAVAVHQDCSEFRTTRSGYESVVLV